VADYEALTMDRIFEALLRAIGSLAHARMLWLMIWPMVVALVVWITLAVLYWGQILNWADVQLHHSAIYEWTISIWPFRLLVASFGWLLLIFSFVPLVLMTAVLVIGVVAMPTMAAHVGSREYPDLARRKGGTVTGSLWNAFLALALFFLAGAVTLPLWLFPLLWPLLPVLLFGWFNQCVYRYDALAEHASAAEMREIFNRHRGELFLLGISLALIGHIPLLGLLMPVYGGLVFLHYGLGRLRELRSEPIQGSAMRV
jgi:CysZ protein